MTKKNIRTFEDCNEVESKTDVVRVAELLLKLSYRDLLWLGECISVATISIAFEDEQKNCWLENEHTTLIDDHMVADSILDWADNTIAEYESSC